MRSSTQGVPSRPDVADVKFTRLQTLHAELQGTAREIGPDQLVALEGATRERVIGVTAGLLRCFRITPDGRRHITRFVGPGGLVGLGTHPTYRNSTEAVTDSSLIVFPAHTLDTGMEKSSTIRKVVLDALTDEMSARDQTQFRVGRLWADERVANFLLEVHSCATTVKSGTGEIRMSRADMADHLGVTIETVSRALNRFQKLNLIKFVDVRHFVVLRPRDLSHFALGDCDEAPTGQARLARSARSETHHAA